MNGPEETPLAPVPTTGPPPPAAPTRQETYQGLQIFTDPTKHVMTNIADDRDGRWIRQNAMASADHQVDDHVGKSIALHSYLAHEVTLTDPSTGEEFSTIRLVLVDKSGDTYSTCSMPFADLFRALLQNFGAGPWEPPLTLEIYKAKRSALSAGRVPGGYLQFKVSKPAKK